MNIEDIILSEIQELKRIALLNAKKALTIEDASILTNISVKYLYKIVREKKIPYCKSAKFIYFDRDELTNWMLQNRVNPK